MIRALMDYGALAAKARAMYGKRLRREDFSRMAAMGSAAELSEYLRSHPAWSACAAHLTGGVSILAGSNWRAPSGRSFAATTTSSSPFSPGGTRP